jgi:hypothetical protein
MGELDTTQLVIADAPQYFFDNGIVESVQNVKRTVHRPSRHPLNPLLRKDRPWEHVPYFGSADYVLWRELGVGQFRCLYTDWHFDRERYADVGQRGTIMDWGITLDHQLYAESTDGIQWTKPPMQIREHEGQDTNIVFGGADYGSVWNLTLVDDPLEINPDCRFKALYNYVGPTTVTKELPGTEMRAAYSADGVHWTPYQETPTFGRCGSRLGDVAIANYDPRSRTYLLNTRHGWQDAWHAASPTTEAGEFAEGTGGPRFDPILGRADRRGRRRIFQCESRDFLHWSEPRLMLAPDPALDNVDDAFYGMNQLQLGDQWVGFLDVFHMVDNTVDVQLVHSRNGRDWRRIDPGKPWLRTGDAGEWDQFMTYHVHATPAADELRLYYGGAKNHHDWWILGQLERNRSIPEAWNIENVGFGLGLATLRLDGFVSLGANRVREGVITTQPFASSGNQLTLNVACASEGYVKVEATDVSGQPLPGCSWNDCDVFDGDSTAHTVTWAGEQRLPASTGPRPPWRRLRFIIRDAELFSFRLSA